MGGGRGEASLPGGPALDLAHRQQAVGGDTLVGHDAKELAGRQAGVFHERLQVAALGQALTRLPGADGGNGNAQITGDSLEWNLVLPAPVAEGARKAGADVTMKIPLLGHGQSVREIRPGVKRAKGGGQHGKVGNGGQGCIRVQARLGNSPYPTYRARPCTSTPAWGSHSDGYLPVRPQPPGNPNCCPKRNHQASPQIGVAVRLVP